MNDSEEQEQIDSDNERNSKLSSIYDVNVGLPKFPTEFNYLAESNYEIFATMKTPEDVETFISLYSSNSSTEWRVLRTYTRLPPTLLYKKAWRCQHNVQQRKNRVKDPNKIKTSKNCHCPGYICISIYSTSARQGPDKGGFYKDYTARMKLNLDHNHDLSTRDALRKRTLDVSIKDKIAGMFQYGHGASAVIKLHLLDLLLINEPQYFSLIHDGKYIPTVSQVQHYLNHFKKNMELYSLKDVIEDYLLTNPEAHIQYFRVNNEANKVISVVTPLMMKVHQHVPRSGKIISISLSAKINRLGTKLLTLSTYSDLGALPLGLIIIQQNDDSNILGQVLREFLKRLTPSDVYFHGQGYPRVIITDHALVPTISGVWTRSLVLASQTSVLKTVWMWLQDAPNGIHFSEREGLYFSFKKIMFSTCPDQCQQYYSDLTQYCSDTCPGYLKFVESQMLCQHLWMEHRRTEKLRKLKLEILPDQSHIEIISSYVYDQILAKMKNLLYSLPEVLDFVLNHLESYYQVRMLKFMNHNLPKSMLSKYLELEESPPVFTLQASDFDKDCYFVLSGDVYHYVDHKHKLCSCSLKNPASPCVHINAVLADMFKNNEYLVMYEEVQDLCPLLLSEHYADLQVGDNTIIIINTLDTNRKEAVVEYVTVNDLEDVSLNELDTEDPLSYVKKEPPDEESSRTSRKRKRDASDCDRSIERQVSNEVKTIPENVAKLISLKSIIGEFPEVFSGAVIQKSMKTGTVQDERDTIVLQNKGMYSIAQTTADAVEKDRAPVFSLSDNVIIIDPKVEKQAEVDADEREFDAIYAKIKGNPSQYKTVIRNMIQVYKTFFDDSE